MPDATGSASGLGGVPSRVAADEYLNSVHRDRPDASADAGAIGPPPPTLLMQPRRLRGGRGNGAQPSETNGIMVRERVLFNLGPRVEGRCEWAEKLSRRPNIESRLGTQIAAVNPVMDNVLFAGRDRGSVMTGRHDYAGRWFANSREPVVAVRPRGAAVGLWGVERCGYLSHDAGAVRVSPRFGTSVAVAGPAVEPDIHPTIGAGCGSAGKSGWWPRLNAATAFALWPGGLLVGWWGARG